MPRNPRSAGRELFVASAVFLFLELALIRWLPAHVLFLTFFTNTVLLASFLGFSLGCMAARGKRDYGMWTTVSLVVTLGAGTVMEWVRLALQDIIDVGANKSAPQMVYFGTEARVSDVAAFVVPIEWVVAVFFVLVTLTMVGIGQMLGRRFAAIPNTVGAYMINIGGSLAGVLAFYACSWGMSPVWWFVLVAAGIIYLLFSEGQLSWWKVALPAMAPLLLVLANYSSVGVIRKNFPVESWSPYYRVNYSPTTRTIVANLLGHQNMVSRKDPYPGYAIPYVLNRAAGQPPFHDILIIGAGSGNDVSRALQWGAPDGRVDAVEIDPYILSLGKRDHPDHPYQDPRVTAYLGDGRNFLRRTNKSYDLIIFALVDSLVLHSSVSNIRLESFLFTKESMMDVRRHLRPGGMFVTYNYFRQGWIVSRLAETVRDAFGSLPVVFTLPHRDAISAEEKNEGFTLLFAGPRAAQIRSEATSSAACLIRSKIAPSPQLADAGPAAGGDCIPLSPAHVEIPGKLRAAEDNWPFLYLRQPMIPALTWRGALIMAVIAFLMLGLFGWRPGQDKSRLSLTMLLLGAGFMLLETKAVVHMALIFGSTWTVNAVVFAAVLVMILLANLWVLKRQPQSLTAYYIALIATLSLNLATPMQNFLGLPELVQVMAAGALVLSPIFCAGVIFAMLFRGVAKPERALAYNTAGALIGGFGENISLLLGFNSLLAIAALIYCASWALANRR